MYTVELYLRVRMACHVEGLSQREAASRFGVARETVKKILRYSEPSRPFRKTDHQTGVPHTIHGRTSPFSRCSFLAWVAVWVAFGGFERSWEM